MPDLTNGGLAGVLEAPKAPYIYKHVNPEGWTRDSLLAMLSHEERLDIGHDNLKLAIAVCDGEKLAERFPEVREALAYIKQCRDASNWLNSDVVRQCGEGSLGILTAMLPTVVFAMMVAACPAIDSDKELWHKFITARPEYCVLKRR